MYLKSLRLHRHDAIVQTRVFQIRIRIREAELLRLDIRRLRYLRIRIQQQPRRRLRLLLLPARVASARDRIVEERVEGSDGGGGLVEGYDRDAVVPAGERVGRVDVGVASAAEGGGVGAASDSGGGLLADLADPDAGVGGAGAVDLGVAAEAEEGRVDSAEDDGRGRAARVAGARREAPARCKHLRRSLYCYFAARHFYFYFTLLPASSSRLCLPSSSL
eukprot:TRINITY_DN10884_c0_g1_i2.p2 TRINITY_DN10884_c0_g1~~TRINITY_DN10884_c0_g1_i2.p2  ORF type:complete len:219 (+),score=13.07 TRINITY_DN10884_c0_g1_i2:890-1546(+)